MTEVTNRKWEWTQELIWKKKKTCHGLMLLLNLMEKFIVFYHYHNLCLGTVTAANIYQTTRFLDVGVLIIRVHCLSVAIIRLYGEMKAVVTKILN